MKKPYYIASCVFMSKYPELGKVIQRYIHERYGLPIWELILSDERFAHPDYYGETAIVQNCWWAKERTLRRVCLPRGTKKESGVGSTPFCIKCSWKIHFTHEGRTDCVDAQVGRLIPEKTRAWVPTDGYPEVVVHSSVMLPECNQK